MSKKMNNKTREMLISGMMGFGTDMNGRETMDFRSDESGVELEPFTGLCKVQKMRDANVYITRLPKRVRNKPLFRQDHSTLSHSKKTRKFYFILTLDDQEDFATTLVREANEAAAKMSGLFFKSKRHLN